MLIEKKKGNRNNCYRGQAVAAKKEKKKSKNRSGRHKSEAREAALQPAELLQFTSSPDQRNIVLWDL